MSGGDRAEFLDIWQQHVTRPGSEKLLDWLDKKTDFFTAPASTRFHGACEGGLCMHSLNVYHALHDSFFTEGESEESYAICALLHDLCKANYYKLGTRNVKNEATGQWEKAPFYSVEDLFPYGHGEKSVFLIERFMKLKVEEAVAIRCGPGRLLCHLGSLRQVPAGGQAAHRRPAGYLSDGAPYQQYALNKLNRRLYSILYSRLFVCRNFQQPSPAQRAFTFCTAAATRLPMGWSGTPTI